MILSREQRIQKLKASLLDKQDSEPLSILDHILDLESRPPSSENRFEELGKPCLAVESFKVAAIEFGHDLCANVNAITNAKDLPMLGCDSVFKYSTPGGGIFSEYRSRLEDKEDVLVFVVQECQAVIGYGLVDLGLPGLDHEVKVVDVETASRRSAGLFATIQVESELFEIGVGHLLVTSIVNHFDNARLHTDATHDSSRYVFKSSGFSSYSANNPCLLESRSKPRSA